MARARTPAQRPTVEETISAEQTALSALLGSLRPNPREVIEPLLHPDQIKEEADQLAGSLRDFVAAAWHLIEPSDYVSNWHIDAICDHLTAITNGDIQDLLITMPPRHSKSLIVAVLWPAWEWITLPFYRWIFSSYAFSLSVRDSLKRRNIVKSRWYQDRFWDRFALVAEQDTKIRFENDKRGFMLASSVGGTNTGEGGERIIADDPHNIKKSESEEVRTDTVNWWNVTMSTRRNDKLHSARVVVQQRVHEADVAGDIIEKGGYVHLNLPTEFMFGGQPRCHTVYIKRDSGEAVEWSDPRQEPGELLNPKRFDAEQNEKAKVELALSAYAAQHGQMPSPPSGTIIQKEWFKYYGGPTGVPIPDWKKSTNPFTPLLSLDCTFKEHKDTDFVAGLGWAMFGSDIYLMPVCIHKRLSFTKTIDAVAEFVGGESLDGKMKWPGVYPFMKIKLVEDKANGSAIIDTLRHKIPGFLAYEPGSASKVSRLTSASWRFKAGNIFLPHESIAPWIIDYVYELCAFPKAKKDDYADATSQAILFLGGDAVVTGAPEAGEKRSNWFSMAGNSDIADSKWGDIGNRSSWRVGNR